ncbi:MAG: helix-turn-helix domain-containing protein [Myxococcota bacterium]|nr:helix-turn-helix domain-containing protein [Myxococcota bacterium]
MSGFYERLGLSPQSNHEEIQSAYHRGLARLVKKHRKAEASGADTAAIEAERHALVEAHGVLSDPRRRRSYDQFLSLESEQLATDSEGFWKQIQEGMVEPGAAAALEVVRSLTSLPVGQSKPEVAPELPPAPDFVTHAAPPVQADLSDPPSMPAKSVPSEEPQLVIGRSTPASAADAKTLNTEASIGFERPVNTELREVQAAALSPRDLGALIEQHGYDGRLLAAVRQARGLTMESVASATNISTRYVQALETNAYDRLPSAIFVRGYLKEIARVLELEVDALTEGYLGLYQRQRGA